ncbi:MAG TPA: oligosaccharide flippase family protein [Firmicutes bacterium]|nr:oligosaccharide flippase family protein [Bacillota bacterium]
MTHRLAKRPLVRSVLALCSSAVFGRLMGMIYRVWLVRVAGQDTIGLVQLVMPIYRVARSIATLGMPVAIAKFTAERSALARHPDFTPYRIGLRLVLLASLAGFLIQALFSRFWAYGVLLDGRTEHTVILLAVLLVPVAISAAMRGALQGLQKQSYLAGADILEVLVRIPITLVLAKAALPWGPEWAAAAVAIGFIAGELGSIVLLKLGMRRVRIRRTSGSGKATVPRRTACTLSAPLMTRDLLKLGIPLMLTGVANNVMSLVTVAAIPRMLQNAGLTLAEATRSYGRLSGMAVPTLYMPMVLIFPLTQVVLPEITRLTAQPDGRGKPQIRKLLAKVYGSTSLIILLVVPLLWFQAERLAGLLYGDATVGKLIRPLAFAAPCAYYGAVSAGVLYGLGKTNATMLSSLTGNMVRLALVYLLAGRPQWGITGALWAFIADYAVTAVIEIVVLVRVMQRLGKS